MLELLTSPDFPGGMIVRYAEFRDHLENALREEGLVVAGADRRVERIDLNDTVRHWKLHLHRGSLAAAEPFHVFATIEFDWSPVDAARAYTCEEDLLAELMGRRRRLPRTERRWRRVDLSLQATLPYGSRTPIPERLALSGWTAAVVEQADAAFNDVEEKDGRIIAVLGGHADLDLRAHCSPDGLIFLDAIAISGFRMVRVPRVWDSPERRAVEADPHQELSRLARTFKTAVHDWTESICALATWIRYSPPPPGAKPTEPWFNDETEDDDSTPETTH